MRRLRADVRPGRLPDRLRPQRHQGGRRRLLAARGGGARGLGGDAGPGRRRRRRPRRQPRRGAVLRPGPARRDGGRGRPRVRRACPPSRHEAACASGSVATLAAMAELEAERYDVALVVGVELMRNVDAQTAAEHLGIGGLGRPRGDRRALPLAGAVQRDRRRVRRALGTRVRAPGPDRGAELRERVAQPEGAGARVGVRAPRVHAGRRRQPRHRGTAAKAGLRSDHRRRGGGRACLARDTPPRTPAAPGARWTTCR